MQEVSLEQLELFVYSSCWPPVSASEVLKKAVFRLPHILIWIALSCLAGQGLSQESFGLKRNYVNVRVSRNYPFSLAERNFSPGYAHPRISYLHNVDDSWLMGLGAGYRVFLLKEPSPKEGDEIAIFTVSHDSHYIKRLYHPTYALLGAHLLYLLPSQRALIPMKRSTLYESEIGAGVSLSVLHAFTPNFGMTFGIQWWRGTSTTRLQGVEPYFELNYATN